jgi:hypothetical protein
MKKILCMVFAAIFLILSCSKDTSAVTPPAEPGYFMLSVSNQTWLDSDIYVEDIFVGRIYGYSPQDIDSFQQSGNTSIKAMYGDSLLLEKNINTLEMDEYQLVIECPTFTLQVENERIYYGDYSFFIDYDIYVNGNYVGKWDDDIPESFNQNEQTQLTAKKNHYPDIESVLDTRGISNYVWMLDVPMFTLYVDCDFDGEGEVFVNDKWSIGEYHSYKITNMGELPQSDNTHLVARPYSPQYGDVEIFVNTVGLDSYTWDLPSR